MKKQKTTSPIEVIAYPGVVEITLHLGRRNAREMSSLAISSLLGITAVAIWFRLSSDSLQPFMPYICLTLAIIGGMMFFVLLLAINDTKRLRIAGHDVEVYERPTGKPWQHIKTVTDVQDVSFETFNAHKVGERARLVAHHPDGQTTVLFDVLFPDNAAQLTELLNKHLD